jgi:hypothetical protein
MLMRVLMSVNMGVAMVGMFMLCPLLRFVSVTTDLTHWAYPLAKLVEP